MKKKYKMIARSGYPIETALDKSPIPGLDKHLGIPDILTEDVIGFTSKFVESFENLNRAYFGNQELALAYNSVSFKALDLEHELDKIIGHLHSHAYVNRQANEIISQDMLMEMVEGKHADVPIDVIVGAVAYVDRFPQLSGPLSRKSWGLSMECYYDSWDLRLENGTMFSLEEAESLGLGPFIDQLMGSFESREDFDRAHSLLVTFADKRQQEMKVYKYLRSILFSGAGCVLNPACPSCLILSTNCDCDDNLKMAASMEVPIIKQFSLDLCKVESYIKSIREHGGTVMVHQVTEDISAVDPKPVEADIKTEMETEVAEVTTVEGTLEDCKCKDLESTVVEEAKVEEKEEPETGSQIETYQDPMPSMAQPPVVTPKVPNDMTSKPAQCPQYRYQEEISCLYANAKCEAVGDRTSKSCLRWSKDDSGVWVFDTMNNKGGDETVVVSDLGGPEVVEASTKNHDVQWLSRKIEQLEYALESLQIEREMEQSRLSEKAATWTTQLVNGLPNSSFAVVETGYKEGMNKNARHLPFKDGSGKVDLPHLRNALARANQIKNVLGKDSDADLRARAQRKLAPFAKRYLKTSEEKK